MQMEYERPDAMIIHFVSQVSLATEQDARASRDSGDGDVNVNLPSLDIGGDVGDSENGGWS